MPLVYEASLHPPPPASDGADAPWPPSAVIIDSLGYIADRRNATTAVAKTADGRHTVQVTFCVAHPPRVSYFCVHSPDFPTAGVGFVCEPVFVATDGDLALLLIAIGLPGNCGSSGHGHNYYIYKASSSPSLHLLPRPPYRGCPYGNTEFGLLCHGGGHHGNFTLRPHGSGDNNPYTIAALLSQDEGESESDAGSDSEADADEHEAATEQFDLLLLRSGDNKWTCKTVAVKHLLDLHETTKAVTVGGECGTIAFVDVKHGILLCDVLRGDPVLRYAPLPLPLETGWELAGFPSHYRDVVFVQGRIKYVQLEPRSDADDGSAGWAAATWTYGLEGWQPDYKIEACDITAANNPVHFELLPEPQEDGAGTPPKNLEKLDIGQPKLSLHHDNVVYFMTKVRYIQDKAWMIAVDMKNKTLQGVAEFGAQRTFFTCFPYEQSIPKRSGTLLLGTSRKKKPEVTTFTDFVASCEVERKSQDPEVAGSTGGAEDGGGMDLG